MLAHPLFGDNREMTASQGAMTAFPLSSGGENGDGLEAILRKYAMLAIEFSIGDFLSASLWDFHFPLSTKELLSLLSRSPVRIGETAGGSRP